MRDGDIYFIQLLDLNKAKIASDNLENPKENMMRNCFWLYGEKTFGKTSLITEYFWEDAYFKNFRKETWELYKNENIFVVDDFIDTNVQEFIKDMLLGNYGLKVILWQ